MRQSATQPAPHLDNTINNHRKDQHLGIEKTTG
jgi:hypothetical protein